MSNSQNAAVANEAAKSLTELRKELRAKEQELRVGLVVGKKLGLKVKYTWCTIFQAQIDAAAGKKPKLGDKVLTKPMTDEEISKFMADEFFRKEGNNHTLVSRHREIFNAGACGVAAPKTPVGKFGADGKPVGEEAAKPKAKAKKAKVVEGKEEVKAEEMEVVAKK